MWDDLPATDEREPLLHLCLLVQIKGGCANG